MKILISDAFDRDLPAKLATFGEVTADPEGFSDAEVVLVRSKTICDREWIDRAAKLRLIIRGGVGLDNIDVGYARARGIQVFNTAEASANAVAELAFALMIAVPTRLVDAHVSMREGRWDKSALKRTELLGRTLGLIGAGNIGTLLARRAIAFGMRVIAHDPLLTTHECCDLVDFDVLLAESDYVSLHVPLTDETRGLINTSTIARMKPGVVIVNTARGRTIVEADMVRALETGRVGAYATDVFETDPPPDDCPLYGAPNVIMTPHIGASSSENMLRVGDVIVRILEDFVQHTA